MAWTWAPLTVTINRLAATSIAVSVLPAIATNGYVASGETAVNLRDAFIKALNHNEDDLATRLVFADWLDEQGEHEEADRQRKWPAAKNWLVRFFREHNQGDYMGELNSYEEMVEHGRVAVAEADGRMLGFDCGSNQGLSDALRANSKEFWKNWSIVTGIPLPPAAEGMHYFGCSC
jgi:uncharacterized protein (TIGR02996 family)